MPIKFLKIDATFRDIKHLLAFHRVVRCFHYIHHPPILPLTTLPRPPNHSLPGISFSSSQVPTHSSKCPLSQLLRFLLLRMVRREMERDGVRTTIWGSVLAFRLSAHQVASQRVKIMWAREEERWRWLNDYCSATEQQKK